MKSRGKLFAIVMVAVMISLLLVGCGSSEGKPSGSTDDPQKLTLGLALTDVRGPFFSALAYGVSSRAEELGVELVLVSAGGYDNIDKQISQLEDLISRKVDGILLDAVDEKAIPPMIDEAVAHNIPVMGTGSQIESTNCVSSVSVDHTELGREMARYLVESMDAKGGILVLAGPSGALWSENRYRGFMEIIEQYPEMEILATQWGLPDRAEGLRLAEDLLGRFPEATGMYAADDAIGQGAGDALVATGKEEQIELVTSVLGFDTEAMIRSGAIDATVAHRTVLIGQLSVDTMMDVIAGNSVEKEIYVPSVTVTKDNIDTINIDEIRQPEDWRP
ncbi:MAG TPA: sugar ABC transporter substrate-binding protein [Firmicutes bacterium]|jgi:ribose transport system substrate-binding protein|nr:sugar ABC transporter substrate-binding protein [Bacillota bacterium]